MKPLETTAMMREMRLLLEIAIMQEATDFTNPWTWFTYIEWEQSRLWLIDVNRGEGYCYN